MKLHDDIHNYYEKLVVEHIVRRKLDKVYDEDVMADFCCTVLNQLPSRYIRYDVDMEFYLPQPERAKMEQAVERAIDFAIAQIAKKEQFQV
ncbi:late competence development ComFB family protein [Pseudoalteromonas sp. S2755]|uniref:late competence development ComFB family protein n=1 Tax=Pseudoalteromonas sp. S2755 TaxID=2066523 RepID=UPI00110AC209|nr:late competence development ComFB family protein [Pseudoalteromonas sp. S2755]TMN46066.1 competence protein ComFB [Pseudoalteromonas sp. S2755]